MSKVTITSLRREIKRQERNKADVGFLSLSEEFALDAFKMLLPRLEAEQKAEGRQETCQHVWSYSMLNTTRTCNKCGKMVTL
jgi:hypothetical protein